PIADELGSGIVLLAQPQQADVAAVTRWETGHFHVIAEEVVRRGQGVDLALEVAFLVIPARTPAQAAADVEILAENVAHHVLRRDAFGRAFVMRAASRVDVVIAGVPALGGGMDPALEMKLLVVRGA